MLQSAIDRLGGTVRRSGVVEVGQDVGGTLVEGPPRVLTSRRTAGTPALTVSMSSAIRVRPLTRSGSR